MSLRERILGEIGTGGPMPLDRYMALCNAHYYATRDPLGPPRSGDNGKGGDFITAPEISQLFGELLGLWAVHEWERLGAPAAFALLELGPGRGTLMHDALRAARVRPAFLSALRLQLLETSPILRDAQRVALKDYGPGFLNDLERLPSLPTLVLANEFFDALPVRQLRRTDAGWREHAVTCQGDTLVWNERSANDIPADLAGAPLNTIIEHNPAARAVMRQLCQQLAAHGGSACLIDYGDRVDPARLQSGDTLQALRAHRQANPLQDPGDSDLTCHVDFAPLLAIAQTAGLATAFGTQGDFLRMLGIEARAAALHTPAADLTRLIEPSQMGSLFKVLTVSSR